MNRLALLGLLVLVVGCDPVIPIELVNETGDTLTVKAYRTIHFSTYDVHTIELSGDYRHSWIAFKVAPRSTIGCGSAIAGIEDEMPFTDLVITKANGDSIIARGETDVLGLFDRGVLGGLETPYRITVR
ncbi:MAG: hypothetical protein KF905_14800 [Flavobacteriales bacterium]|nr:hypothetical protein [Flavobacteriales bacterium]